MESAILRQFQDDMDRFYADLAEEKRIREDNEEALLEYLKEIVTSLKDEIDREREQREATEETLLGLLEGTCSKLNAASQI